jgi:hypothetical protein
MKESIALLKDEKERFIWISGRAGTEKSTFLQYLKTEIRPHNAVFLAPTAVAALTIGGQTIHSFLWIDPNEKAYLETTLDPDRGGRLYPLLVKVETIVLNHLVSFLFYYRSLCQILNCKCMISPTKTSTIFFAQIFSFVIGIGNPNIQLVSIFTVTYLRRDHSGSQPST